jgi:hypothetical protein
LPARSRRSRRSWLRRRRDSARRDRLRFVAA